MARIGSPRTATRCGSREPVEDGSQAVDRGPGVAICKCGVPDQDPVRGLFGGEHAEEPDAPLRAKPPPRRDCCAVMTAT